MFKPAITIVWCTLNMVGQFCLFILLLTLYLVRDLPARNNPFLVNMLFSSFIATFPTLLLLYTGQIEEVSIPWVCQVQSALMDGIAPFWGFATFILVVHIWSNLRSTLNGQTSVFLRSNGRKWAALAFPYILLVSWSLASFIGALQPPVSVRVEPFVFCSDQGPLRGFPVRKLIGPFFVIFAIIAMVLEGLSLKIIYGNSTLMKKRKDIGPRFYKETVHLLIRLCLYSLMQATPLLLTGLNWFTKMRSFQIADATEVIEATYPLWTFLIFGSQKSVLQAWKILPADAEQMDSKENVV